MKKFSVVLFALFVTQVMAQTSGSSLNTTSGDISGSSFMKVIRNKLQVLYFSEFLGPNVVKWDDNQVGTTKNGDYSKGTEPIGMFHQFSVRWKFAGSKKIFLEPRLTTHFGSRSDLRSTDDQSAVRMEDFRAGISDNYWRSEDNVFSTTYRLGNRFPTSQASKDANITAQPELLHITSAQLNKDLNISIWNQIRYFWYENDVDQERWRLYTGPSVTYTLSDTYSIFVMYEHELQHNAKKGERSFSYAKETLQDVYAGVNINLNPSLTIYPFIRMAQLKKINDETLQVGAWVMGAIF